MSRLDVMTQTRDVPLSECLATPAQQGAANLFWLGQAGFALRTATGLAVLDAYLSDALAEKYKNSHYKYKRMMPAPVEPEALRGVELLFASHGHSDHLDPWALGRIMEVNPECRLICPTGVVATAIERGAPSDRIEAMRVFEKRRFGAMEVELLPAAHETLDVDADGNTAFGGFVLGLEGMRLYHSGDCVRFAGQAELLRERAVDAAMLPVNGRDAERTANGVIGNFSVDEAAELCVDAGIGLLIPQHFGMFDFNTVSPATMKSDLEKWRERGLTWFIPDAERFLSINPVK